MASVHLTLRSLLRQKARPGSITLVLAAEEFPGQELPANILALRPRGVRVKWVGRNTRSYKKLIPVLEDGPALPVVTFDDDVIYPRDWMEPLLKAHELRPRAIVGSRGREITMVGDQVEPYRRWDLAHASTRSTRLLLTGVGGVLYPPNCLPEQALDSALALRLCPTADDIWFKAMSLKSGTEVTLATRSSRELPVSRIAERKGLQAQNVKLGANDQQFKDVMDHFSLWSSL